MTFLKYEETLKNISINNLVEIFDGKNYFVLCFVGGIEIPIEKKSNTKIDLTSIVFKLKLISEKYDFIEYNEFLEELGV